jgi:hypothetical protein
MGSTNRKPGTVVRIPVTHDLDAYAQVLESPEIAVFKTMRPRGTGMLSSDVETEEVLFRIWVTHSALTRGRWQRIFVAPIRPELTKPVPRFKRDPISGQFSTYMAGADRPASPAECRGLEPASVWSAEHVEARLRDYISGRRHAPLERMLEGISGRDDPPATP